MGMKTGGRKIRDGEIGLELGGEKIVMKIKGSGDRDEDGRWGIEIKEKEARGIKIGGGEIEIKMEGNRSGGYSD